ncbi:MAG: amidohydrolase family protein [Symbiobacteriia bacterium]
MSDIRLRERPTAPARDLILINAAILDGDGRFYEGRHIVIRDGRVAQVVAAKASEGRAERPAQRRAERPAALAPATPRQMAEVVDCAGCVVTPGLTVLHGHAPMVLFRGLAEDVTIDDWFNRRIWPYESHLTVADVTAGTRLAIAEMLENGVTAFADHYMFADAIADVVLETGIRADLAPTIFGLGDGVGERIENATRLIAARRADSPRLTFRMGPHAPYTCPQAVLSAIVKRARELGVGLHIHVSETEAQVQASLEREGRTPFAALATAGGFDLPVLVAHGLWVREEDLDFFRPDTWFAASPKTYLKLAMGEGGLWRLRDRLQVAIGTDGAASSNTLSPLEQVRLWALLGKHSGGEAARYTLTEAWSLLMNGHKALGTNTGAVAPSRDADLVVWDLQQPNTAPVHNPLAAILYSAESRNIRDVLVQGQFLKRDHRLLTINPQRAVREAAAAAQRLTQAGPGPASVAY